MTREEVKAICIRVNKGEPLEEVIRPLGIRRCYIESLIKEYGFKYSNILKKYYSKKFESEIIELEKEKKSNDVINDIEDMWLKRYYGIDTDDYDGLIEEEWADSPREEFQIHLNNELYSELLDISAENGTSVDFIIEQGLLKILERNRETRKKKQNKLYLRNICDGLFSLKSTQEQLENETIEERFEREIEQKEEFLKEIEKNIKRKDFLIKSLTYKDIGIDCEIYMKSYLVGKGYTKANIKEIELLEKNFKGESLLIGHYDYKSDDEFKNMSYEDIKEILLKEYEGEEK